MKGFIQVLNGLNYFFHLGLSFSDLSQSLGILGPKFKLYKAFLRPMIKVRVYFPIMIGSLQRDLPSWIRPNFGFLNPEATL